MRRARGFKLRVRSKLVKIYKWVSMISRRRKSLQLLSTKPRNPITKVLNLARCCFKQFHGKRSGYVPLGHDPGDFGSENTRPGKVCGGGIPKGHLAVYVGESQDETQRYLVPVIYFNHPLFGELLKEAERVYGFNHPGRITIPCGPSEFEKVQMRIASGASRRDSLQRRRI